MRSTATPRTSVRPVTSVRYQTISGAVQTHYITSQHSGTPVPASGSSADVQAAKDQGLSNGAVAGITIGVVAALAVAGLFFFFCCWRKRKEDKNDGPGINRNTSVLSKVGLLRHGSTKPSPPATGIAEVPVSRSAPQLDTDLPGTGISGPSSAASQTMLERRDSRPLFRDQRLNPNALMLHSDTSRTSVGTLQDDKDYSRPLEVCKVKIPNEQPQANTSARSAIQIPASLLIHDNASND